MAYDDADPRIPKGLKLVAALVVLIVAAVVIFEPSQTPQEMRSFLLKNGFAQVQITDRDGYCGRGRQVFLFTAQQGDQALAGKLCGGNLRGATYVMETHPVR